MVDIDENSNHPDAPESDSVGDNAVGTAKTRRRRWRRVLVRCAVYGFLLSILLPIAAYFTIHSLVHADDIKRQLKQIVEEQTGGKLDIGALSFDLLRGIKLENVQFYPPAAGDTRGFAHGGTINPIPITNFDALNISYSLKQLLVGQLRIKAVELVEPQVHLKRQDGIWNFDSILAYRQIKFPPPPESAPEAAEQDASKGSTIPNAAAYISSMLYMPIEIWAEHIGIRNLRLDMITEEQGNVSQIIMSNGVSFDVGAYWYGRKSSFWFNSLSPFERPLELEVRDAKKDAKGKLTNELISSLAIKTALNVRFELANFREIRFDFATRILQLATPAASFSDLGAFVKVRLATSDDYKTLQVETIRAEVADALAYGLKGSISTANFDFEQIALKLSQDLHIDLQKAAILAKPFLPEMTAGGEINADALEIEGTLEPQKLKNLEAGLPIPNIWGVVWIEEIFINDPRLGIQMEPISGDVQLSAGPAMNGQGSQIDLDVDIVVPQLIATQNVQGKKLSAGVEDLSFKLTTKALWPEMIAPVLKLNIEAAHVRSFTTNQQMLDVPLYIDVDADGRKDLQHLSLSSNIELAGLAEMNAMIDCQNRCTRLRSSVNSRLDALSNLHRLALPFTNIAGLGEFMPTKLGGSVDMQFAARGELPDPTVTPIPELIKKSVVQFNAQFNLAKLSTRVPAYQLALDNFDTRLVVNGNLQQQKLDLTQKFDRLSLTLPAAAEDKQGDGAERSKTIEVQRYSLDTSINNDIEGPLNLNNLMQQLSTNLTTRLHLARVSMDGVLPRPLSDIQLNLDVAQTKLSDIDLRELVVKIPDFGTNVRMQTQTKIGADFLPLNLNTNIKASIAHNGEEKLPLGIKTSGKIDVRLQLASTDMRQLALDGEASFDEFNATIPGAEAKPALLVVEGIKGQIPFKQIIPLPDLKAIKNGVSPLEAMKAAQTGKQVAESKPANNAESPDDEADANNPQQDNKAANQAMAKYMEKNTDTLSENANVAAMVDYGTIRPFFPERRPLSIKRLEAANLELSQMEFDLELRQNWFALNQYVINFLGGKLQGDLQLAFDPMPRSIRTSLHMTRLDTRKLLERFPNLKGKSGWSPFANPYIDGTVHLLYDLKNNDMSGGIEITSIGKDQLKAMLYYIDPFEQNPTISDIRTALSFGDVRHVSIPLKNGEIDLAVDVRVLVPLPLPKLSRFPISQILQNFKDQALKDSSSGELESKDSTPESKDASENSPTATTAPDKEVKGI